MPGELIRIVPGLHWARDGARVRVVCPAQGWARWLEGWEAATWDWAQLGYSRAGLEEMLAAARADCSLDDVLARWRLDGLLQGETR